MAERQSNREKPDRPRVGEKPDRPHVGRDRLEFDHHREERSRSIGASRWGERSFSADRSPGGADDGWRDDRDRELTPGPRDTGLGTSRGFDAGSQEYGRQGYGGGAYQRHGSREWSGTDTWRVPGPHAGRGPRGYQRSDDRIREELNDRLTAHGFIDATDIECQVKNGEVTLSGFVDSRETKRAAEHVAEDIPGVHDVHNNLRIRSPQERMPRSPAAADDIKRSRTRIKS